MGHNSYVTNNYLVGGKNVMGKIKQGMRRSQGEVGFAVLNGGREGLMKASFE